MLLGILIITVCVHLAHMCPTSLQSCDCGEVKWYDGPRLIIRCNALSSTDLAQVAETKKLVHLTLEGFEMKHLASQPLAGLRLRKVTLERCKISSVDDRTFSDPLQTLEFISLASNELERVPTSSLQNLTNLKVLYLDHNRLEVLHADSFKGISFLETLALKSNKLRSIDDAAFQIGSRFNFIYLTSNDLTAFPSRPLSRINYIKVLHLGYNKISSLLPEEMAAVSGKNLSVLYLNNNRIQYLLPRTFESLRGLSNLILGTNGIESIHPHTFQGIEDTLTSLSLDGNLLQEVPAASLKNMSRLSWIFLSDNQICAVRKDDFWPYGKTLEYLFLRNISLTTVEPRSFVGLNSIEYLDLTDNQLTALPHEIFTPVLDSLRTLRVYGNPLHCDREVNWLKDLMVNSEVIDNADRIKCDSPTQYRGMVLKKIPQDILTRQDSTTRPQRSCIIKKTEPPDSLQNVADSTLIPVTEKPTEKTQSADAGSQEGKTTVTETQNEICDTLQIKQYQEESCQLVKNAVIEGQNKIYSLLLEMKKDQEEKQLEKNLLIETQKEIYDTLLEIKNNPESNQFQSNINTRLIRIAETLDTILHTLNLQKNF